MFGRRTFRTRRCAKSARKRTMIILGIDPGTKRMGFGVIRAEGGRATLLATGILKVKSSGAEGLREIKSELTTLIQLWRPEAFAIERLFFVKNQTTGLTVAEARGIALVTAAEAGVPIHEFSPNEVKAGL